MNAWRGPFEPSVNIYLRIERFLRNRRNPLRICRRPMAAVRPWYNNSIYKTGEIYEVYI